MLRWPIVMDWTGKLCNNINKYRKEAHKSHYSFMMKTQKIRKRKELPNLNLKLKSHLMMRDWSLFLRVHAVQFSSVIQSCPPLCNPMNCSTPGLPVHHQLPEFTQTHVHPVSDAIQPSHFLSSHSPPAFNLSQHQGLFQWVNSLHEVARVLEFQLQHQSLQWTPRTDLL